MKSRLRKNKNGNGNRQHLHGSTPENRVSTSKMSTSNGRFDIRIPKNSKIYKYLYVDKKGDNRANWKRLDSLLEIADISYETHSTKVWDDFIARMAVLYPEKVGTLQKLRALIIWHICWGEDLPEKYIENLKNI